MAPAEMDLYSRKRPPSGDPRRRAKFAVRSHFPTQTSPSAPGLPFVQPSCGKKTRYIPDLSVCHVCARRCPEKDGKISLLTLKSQWRVLLLCSTCLANIRSGAVCSYCLSRFLEVDQRGSISCLKCRRHVHLECLPRQRGYVVPTDLDPRMFVCVDCSVVPQFLLPRVHNHKIPSSVLGVSLVDVVNNAKYVMLKKEAAASRAKEKALCKALVASCAAELARSALDLVTNRSKGASDSELIPDLADQTLAIQLHRAINGSQRILRNCHSQNSGGYVIYSEKRISGDLGRMSLTGNQNVPCVVQTCVEKRSFERSSAGITESLLSNLQVQGETPPGLISFVDETLENESEERKCNQDEDMGKREQACCSEKAVSSTFSDSSFDVICRPSVQSTISSDNLGLPDNVAMEDNVAYEGLMEHTHADQLPATCNIHDRYVKKYFRNVKMKRYGKIYCRNFRQRSCSDKKVSDCQSTSYSNTSISNRDDCSGFITLCQDACLDPKHLS